MVVVMAAVMVVRGGCSRGRGRFVVAVRTMYGYNQHDSTMSRQPQVVMCLSEGCIPQASTNCACRRRREMAVQGKFEVAVAWSPTRLLLLLLLLSRATRQSAGRGRGGSASRCAVRTRPMAMGPRKQTTRVEMLIRARGDAGRPRVTACCGGFPSCATPTPPNQGPEPRQTRQALLAYRATRSPSTEYCTWHHVLHLPLDMDTDCTHLQTSKLCPLQ